MNNISSKYIAEMEKAIEYSENDVKDGHKWADSILCTLLKELGYTEIVDIYFEVEKSYHE